MPQHSLRKNIFAYDTNITNAGSTLADFEQVTNSELMYLFCWLQTNMLSLNIKKTVFMVIGSCQKLLAESYDEINIRVENQQS